MVMSEPSSDGSWETAAPKPCEAMPTGPNWLAELRQRHPWQGPGLKVISMFDGIGAIWLALYKLGIPIAEAYTCEIDEDAERVVEVRFPQLYPDTKLHQLGDVRNVRPEDVQGPVDLIVAGSPCQDLSQMGLKKGLHGPQSKLFFEVLHFMNMFTPKWFLLENVASMSWDARIEISKHLGCLPLEVNAAELTAMSRSRFFWTNLPLPANLPNIRNHPCTHLQTALNGAEALQLKIKCVMRTNCDKNTGNGTLQPVRDTLTGSLRYLKVDEVEQLFGFPVGWTDVFQGRPRKLKKGKRNLGLAFAEVRGASLPKNLITPDEPIPVRAQDGLQMPEKLSLADLAAKQELPGSTAPARADRAGSTSEGSADLAKAQPADKAEAPADVAGADLADVAKEEKAIGALEAKLEDLAVSAGPICGVPNLSHLTETRDPAGAAETRDPIGGAEIGSPRGVPDTRVPTGVTEIRDPEIKESTPVVVLLEDESGKIAEGAIQAPVSVKEDLMPDLVTPTKMVRENSTQLLGVLEGGQECSTRQHTPEGEGGVTTPRYSLRMRKMVSYSEPPAVNKRSDNIDRYFKWQEGVQTELKGSRRKRSLEDSAENKNDRKTRWGLLGNSFAVDVVAYTLASLLDERCRESARRINLRKVWKEDHLRLMSIGEIWALYDESDRLPNWYGKIVSFERDHKGLVQSNKGLKIYIQWYEFCDGQVYDCDNVPYRGTGLQQIDGPVEEQRLLAFSHRLTSFEDCGDGTIFVYPKEGDAWCIRDPSYCGRNCNTYCYVVSSRFNSSTKKFTATIRDLLQDSPKHPNVYHLSTRERKVEGDSTWFYFQVPYFYRNCASLLVLEPHKETFQGVWGREYKSKEGDGEGKEDKVEGRSNGEGSAEDKQSISDDEMSDG